MGQGWVLERTTATNELTWASAVAANAGRPMNLIFKDNFQLNYWDNRMLFA